MDNRYDPRAWKGDGTWMLPALLLVLLIASVILNIYQYRSHNRTEVRAEMRMDSVITQRVNIEKELSLTSSELDKYKGISAKLDSVVTEGQGRISQQEEKIRNLMRVQGSNTAMTEKLRKELEELKRLKEEYLERIDLLLTENNELREKTRKLDSTVAALNVQRNTLEKRISAASALRAESPEITSLRKKNNGRYSETSLARRTNRLDICFYLPDNRAAEPGERSVYVRILSPENKVIGNRSMGSSSFMTPETNEELLYTVRKVINYNNERQQVCTFYEEEEEAKSFPPGQYSIEIYVEGYLASTTNYTLR